MTDLGRPTGIRPGAVDAANAADAAAAVDAANGVGAAGAANGVGAAGGADAANAAGAAYREPFGLSAADAAFLERCREDLDGLFGPTDAVDEIVLAAADDGSLEMEARVVVSGRPAKFSARGETMVEAYGRLRALAPEQRLVLAFRALVDQPVRP